MLGDFGGAVGEDRRPRSHAAHRGRGLDGQRRAASRPGRSRRARSSGAIALSPPVPSTSGRRAPPGPTAFPTSTAASSLGRRRALARTTCSAAPPETPDGGAHAAASARSTSPTRRRWSCATDVPAALRGRLGAAGHPRHRRQRSDDPEGAGAATGDERVRPHAPRRGGRARHQPADARLQAVPLRDRLGRRAASWCST